MKLLSILKITIVFFTSVVFTKPLSFTETDHYIQTFTDHGPGGKSSIIFGKSRIKPTYQHFAKNHLFFGAPIDDKRGYYYPKANIDRTLLYPISHDDGIAPWNNNYVEPQKETLTFEESPNGHITPDFSNGLNYHDPYLRTGKSAKQLVDYLYSKQLFFDDYPHVRALLNNQRERQENGLEENRINLEKHNPNYGIDGINGYY